MSVWMRTNHITREATIFPLFQMSWKLNRRVISVRLDAHTSCTAARAHAAATTMMRYACVEVSTRTLRLPQIKAYVDPWDSLKRSEETVRTKALPKANVDLSLVS